MQRTVISMAVAWACRKIGEEWQQKQHIAEFNRKANEAKQKAT